MKHITTTLISRAALLLAAAGWFASCGPGVDMPKGTRAGYNSARLVQRDPNRPAITDATEQQVHRMIQNSIASQFKAQGMAWGSGSSDLIVAYMVIYQEPGMTATYDDWFGYGRDSDQIADVAHERGALDNQRPDYFRQAGIVIDVIDARTNKLVYRNFAKGDVVKGASSSTRSSRIHAAVGQALAEFFR